MLELNDLQYQPATTEQPVLKGINLRVSSGRPVLISGASGSGKTSLIEVVSGLAGEQRGTVTWKGQSLTRRQRRWLCGVLFQFPERHFLGLSVSQELKLGHRRLSTDAMHQALRRVGLSNVDLKQAPERLSGGQQRRLALAVQLMRQTDVLLLDEPTAGLDWSVRDDVLELLQDLARDKVLIVVTHEPDLFQRWECEQWKLQAGQLRALSPLAAVD
ncbi:ABC transporter ATP-binding protein [Synechococcus sp. RS9916]|uniref:ABC transporter ATP-binding protein n=1 Tax=Synechococcus sp. RS9916 TaxID=221359 RepID=UPI0000E53EF1|nr:ABC transporter ATP-binding protein [Synechococcus sp. RS9916]EAU73918.1 possible ABC transporter, ATP-binding component [Synechococcus sp. RS9916]